MSDFFNSGWSLYVAGITIVSLVFCLVLLIIASRRKVMADDNTTGHVWDEDLRELNNPLPRWWAGLFLVTVAFAVIYLALYPGLGSNKGTLDWTSTGQHSAEMDKARAQMAPLYAKFVGQSAEELSKDPQAMAIGERLFANNCAQCHGADARGSKGFPNLTDNDWLHGGTLEKIKETITAGRVGNMAPMAAAVGTPEDVKNVAQYVLSLSGSPHNEVAAQLGKPKFVVCAACHGPDGKGMQAIGSANLTDKIWLHGYGEQAIVDMINNGKVNIMPAQAARLSPEQIHVLGAYVWSLSQTSTVAAR
ncbi:cytochrome-c oxidase, cbb3-type subunit III [Rubrivivax gelatinosus]|jgi:cytochrome c oxidase cbb3-type subunit 3|uniref:Cbb3-type cytochrome c oxidase subunit n=1 Tax=Rubrivivax gelatinosus TaxID=28068 RepID=A0A4R2MF18_RUBGE|nr:cytochrome-c oxidase, cbb3-type subunit III [Rubrivivax gelatinosus]MBK1688857.1 cytochrome-c oxidase, cbb3-type subunit III [Rubrivivax gelatinosus]TCP03104.1 cytochrome c oxidase cbb3-type subunit 3 [Rubrivivax gelatinosus]